MKTAVEFLASELSNHLDMPFKHFDELLEQAKEMEKQQIENAYDTRCMVFKERLEDGSIVHKHISFEKYYNETFKK